jgi:glucose-1-phosphate cytidylyltransferase
LKVIILAGGLGTRISEETGDKPKPMVEINSKPILWHLMSVFAEQGFTDFVVAKGYKGEVISNWISSSDSGIPKSWTVTALDTGLETQTAGRIRQYMFFVGEERVIVTYGDGLANLDINQLIDFHDTQGTLATVTAVHPPARFGYLEFSGGLVRKFGEKNQADAGWINGGFFVLEPSVMELIVDDFQPFETTTLPELTERLQLSAFKHEGFWQPMDTLREKNDLEKLGKNTPPPWLAF